MDQLVSKLIQKPQFVFKSLRLGECVQETEIPRLLQDLLDRDKGLFLERYARYMDQEELALFSIFSEDYEVQWHLKQYLNAVPPSAKRIRNRRYKYLTDSMGPDYFDDDAIRDRDPILYHEFIGQHMTEQEKTAPFPNEMRLVDRMYHDIDSARYEAAANVGGTEEEFDTDEDLEAEDADERKDSLAKHGETRDPVPDVEDAKEDDAKARAEFLQLQRMELHRIISEKFIDGLDKEFDYSEVDGNPEYDDLALENQRLSDAYFDTEDPS